MSIKNLNRVLAVFFLFSVSFPPHMGAFASGVFTFNPSKIELQPVVDGLVQPIWIGNAGDGSGRLFIVERAGRVRIFSNGSLLSAPFLDIRSIVNSTGGEQGLLALAFHPGYDSNGQFYTVYTDATDSLVLSRFTRSSTDPDLADPDSRVTLLTIRHPNHQNHNGGTLAFGPDGYLYWSTGDGGGGGDPSNNGQNLNSLLGKILRLDVDSGSPYSIPASNPFFNSSSSSVRKEIWAYGLRNPWRFSFDRQTGDMYIGDVGQGSREEIDFQPASSTGGENYGWRVMEGSLCYNPASGCNRQGKVLPVAQYSHSTGCSITGGYVYRGTQYPALQGYYFYGDFCTGVLFSLFNNPPAGWTVSQIADTPYRISTFGEDENGELYLTDYVAGTIYQLQYNADVLAPGEVTDLTAAAGASDGSVDLQWIAPPDDAGDDSSGLVASYLVRYSASPIVSEADWDSATLVSSGLPAPTAPGTPQTMTVFGLASHTLYYFAVRAQDEQPNLSNYVVQSAISGFTSAALLGAPQLGSPANRAMLNNPMPLLDWRDHAPSAAYYQVQVSTENTFTSTLYDQLAMTSEFQIPANLAMGGPYYWRVSAYDFLDQQAIWSTIRSFTIDIVAPAAPVLRLPADAASVRSVPVFRWNAVSDAVLYEFQLDNDADFSSLLVSVEQRTLSRKPAGGLRGMYSWRVRAKDAAGNWGDWSSTFTVTVTRTR